MGSKGVPVIPGDAIDADPRFADLAGDLPALVRAQRVSDIAAAVGFDWTGVRPVVDKVKEELEEVVQALTEGSDRCLEEVGDLLFATVNLARHVGVEAEVALDQATARFMDRFMVAERLARQAGRTLDACDEAELDALWEQAKALLR